MREITKRFAGIDLLEEEAALSDDICTVYTVLEGNQRAALLLSADTPLLIRLAQHIMHSQTVTQQDIEDVATEYFNVIDLSWTSNRHSPAHAGGTGFSTPSPDQLSRCGRAF